ncbi:MAG: hypothetical protein GX605_10355 [Chloroflexi bacterium]|nr:hypothetical protein [Chloroflexota bacterium]
MGLLVPQAPGTSQPGALLEDLPHQVFLGYTGAAPVSIPLTPSDEAAAQLAGAFPPEPGTECQALTVASEGWRSKLPARATTFRNVEGSLFYTMGFGGSQPCIGSPVTLTFCSQGALPPPPRLPCSGR